MLLLSDCSARPGRPPKRSSISATPETLEKLKKGRFEGAGDYPYSPNKWLGKSGFCLVWLSIFLCCFNLLCQGGNKTVNELKVRTRQIGQLREVVNLWGFIVHL